jgi:hypothetical protein
MRLCSTAFQRYGVQVCALVHTNRVRPRRNREQIRAHCIHTNNSARARATKLRNHVNNCPCVDSELSAGNADR